MALTLGIEGSEAFELGVLFGHITLQPLVANVILSQNRLMW